MIFDTCPPIATVIGYLQAFFNTGRKGPQLSRGADVVDSELVNGVVGRWSAPCMFGWAGVVTAASTAFPVQGEFRDVVEDDNGIVCCGSKEFQGLHFAAETHRLASPPRAPFGWRLG